MLESSFSREIDHVEVIHYLGNGSGRKYKSDIEAKAGFEEYVACWIADAGLQLREGAS